MTVPATAPAEAASIDLRVIGRALILSTTR
jgi:hypothetical protein